MGEVELNARATVLKMIRDWLSAGAALIAVNRTLNMAIDG